MESSIYIFTSLSACLVLSRHSSSLRMGQWSDRWYRHKKLVHFKESFRFQTPVLACEVKHELSRPLSEETAHTCRASVVK